MMEIMWGCAKRFDESMITMSEPRVSSDFIVKRYNTILSILFNMITKAENTKNRRKNSSVRLSRKGILLGNLYFY
jgi:hypothetical protein